MSSDPTSPTLEQSSSSVHSPSSLHLPESRRTRDRSPSPMRGYLIPSPLPTRRTRTFSATVRASEGPIYKGVCKCFCRSKGHGFITPADGGPDIFVHISELAQETCMLQGMPACCGHDCSTAFPESPPEHRRRVRSRGRRRGHLQGVHHSSEEREASGRGGRDYPPSPRNQARDLVGACHQLLKASQRQRRCCGHCLCGSLLDNWLQGT
ncbi:calcium-regulated heat-stable protein 1 [Cygnus atratus]|uniref:calcium-regulated heat-stable protein 1 n=1 Tax=Cygnus atratus TaxID=8868 RepID=UPI0021B79F56|nr:calcium-regulated heat-stable protein 1 [Cygnus atratus]